MFTFLSHLSAPNGFACINVFSSAIFTLNEFSKNIFVFLVDEEWSEGGEKPDKSKTTEEGGNPEEAASTPEKFKNQNSHADENQPEQEEHGQDETPFRSSPPNFPLKVKSERKEAEERGRSRSPTLGESGDEAEESEELDARRKRRWESGDSGSRRKSPSKGEMNGTLSVPQFLQNLPYLHLLPPSIRNGMRDMYTSNANYGQHCISLSTP